jgi:hypothetical protein
MANATLFNGQVTLTGSAGKNKHILNCKLQDCNGAFLDIEYSYNGKEFNYLTSLQVNEFDIQRGLIHYTRDVLTNAPSYYRIKVNKTGVGFYYTNTVRLASEATLASVSLFPNPFTNTLQLSGNFEDVSSIRVQNTMGQTMILQQVSTGNRLELQTTSWSNGIYYVSVFYRDGSVESLKVVK